jgi:hypothetical protein
VVRRLLGLVLISLVIYAPGRAADSWAELGQLGVWGAIRGPLKCDWFQTLMHIAVTSLWVLPVMHARARTRLAFMLASAGIHLVLSQWFYFAWVNNGQPNAIDGGPLGFLTWTIPVILGSLCSDEFLVPGRGPRVARLAGWSLMLMGLGYAMSCGTRFYDIDTIADGSDSPTKIAESPVIPSAEMRRLALSEFAGGDRQRLLAEPPFVPPPHPAGQIDASYRYRQWNYWMMSQRSGTLSYLSFSTGFSLALFVVFHLLCDRMRWQLGVLRTFGTNALVGYVLHMLVADAVLRFMPQDAPAWYMWTGCAIYLCITYTFVRGLERAGVYIRI